MIRVTLLALVTALAACAPESSRSPVVVLAPTSADAAALVAPEVAAEPVLRLSDVNLPAGMLETAVARWRDATGLEIEIGASGVPVEIVADAFSPRGQVCAVTESDATGPLAVRIDGTAPAGHGCRDTAGDTAHEIGHALCRFYAPVDGDCHTRSGLMAHRAELGAWIDEASLEKVCEFAPCSTFNPE